VRLLLASRNPHKLRELRAALPGWDVELLETPEEPVEDGSTFLENARIKARHGRVHAPADAWVAGEDAGIEVDARGGRPGIHSARWADDPVERLLAELQGVENRRARYVCELVAIGPDGAEVAARGTLEGAVALEPHGHEGFGYDPIFVPEGESRTVAELGNGWKALHSHRAQAARALAVALGGRRTLLASAPMDPAQALEELHELSSQIAAAAVLAPDGTVLASTDDDPVATAALAGATMEILAAAAELTTPARGVTRVEVELQEGALFVLREGERTIAARTGPQPTSGLVVYDLRTCLQRIAEPEAKPTPKRASRKKDDAE